MRLLLLRHGQTPANVLGKLNTAAPGPGLTELGVRQAAAIPLALRRQPVHSIYASTLIRTEMTAAAFAENRALPVTVLAGLREIEAGDLEDLSDSRSQMMYISTAFAWAEGDLDRRLPNGPTGHYFFERFDDAIAQIVAAVDNGTNRTVAIFSHGMAIRTWAASRAQNIANSYASDHELDNTGMVVLDSAPDGPGWVLNNWVSAPVGGTVLHDEAAQDPTGETLQDAREHLAE